LCRPGLPDSNIGSNNQGLLSSNGRRLSIGLLRRSSGRLPSPSVLRRIVRPPFISSRAVLCRNSIADRLYNSRQLSVIPVQFSIPADRLCNSIGDLVIILQ
jgi:hypothetical protein